VTDLSYLSNAVVNSPLEVGSIMKTLTAATALNEGVVTPSTAFYNDGYVMVGDRKITDVVNSQGTQTVETVLSRSLNTGAVWLLKQIGQGEINERARFTWHDYLTKRYHLGEITGVEQAGEAEGFIPSPEDTGYGINVTYANTAFGQAMTATPLQMAAAFSSIINGGTYYQPRLVDSYRDTNGIEHEKAPAIKQQGVVSANTSQQMITLLQGVAARNNPGAVRSGYIVGSKSGTAEIAKPDGSGYYADKFNGTYIGFVGGDKPEYVIVIRVNEPGIPGHAGAVAAAPLFKDVSNMLIDNFGVTPKTQ
jgi:cell division protein FtsI/penicillin-binding protein 2